MEKYRGAPAPLRQEVREAQNHVCAYCGSPNHHLSVHHIIPHSRGGPDAVENLVGLCRTPCHDRMDEKYFKEGKTFFDVLMEEGVEYDLPPQLRKIA